MTAPRTWTAAELAGAEFAPLRWIVEALLPSGLTLLAGSPKIGKSWLAFALALAVAVGRQALGRPVERGTVLYLALEDTPRRLQGRQRVLLGDSLTPREVEALLALEVWFDCPPLADGGGKAIVEWLRAHPSARLVVIDVLAKVTASAPRGSNPYHAEYQELAKIKKVADGYGVGILVIHHDRKAESADILKRGVSGTQGQSGAPDTVMVLERPRNGRAARLFVTGRDVPETVHKLVFEAGIWTLDAGGGQAAGGPDAPDAVRGTRGVVLSYLAAHPGCGPKALAEGTGLRPPLVRQHLARAVRAGQARRQAQGRYTAVTPVTPVTAAGQSTPARVTVDQGGCDSVTPPPPG